jgi:hypothetical protein
MLLAIGDERVYVSSVQDEGALRHATFSTNPMIVVVDAERPPSIEPHALAAALNGLPDATLSVVFAASTEYGRTVRAHLPDGASTLFIERADGVEPLHDLVLSRHKSATVPPPPGLL